MISDNYTTECLDSDDHKAATNSTQFALRNCDGTVMITLPAANYVLRVHKDTLFVSIL